MATSFRIKKQHNTPVTLSTHSFRVRVHVPFIFFVSSDDTGKRRQCPARQTKLIHKQQLVYGTWWWDRCSTLYYFCTSCWRLFDMAVSLVGFRFFVHFVILVVEGDSHRNIIHRAWHILWINAIFWPIFEAFRHIEDSRRILTQFWLFISKLKTFRTESIQKSPKSCSNAYWV